MLEHLTQNFQTYLSGAPIVAIAAAFVAGVLVSLTPCVYPMIPITVAVIGGGSAGASRGRSLLLASLYVLGLAITYAALGIASAVANKMFGFAASSPIVLGIVAVFFIVFGLSMVDAFNLPLPMFLTNFQPKQRGGLFGALLMGALSGFVAAPCSSPVLLAILTHIAQHGGVVYGSALMFSYALGMGVLMLVIGFSAGAAFNMPKSGSWMVWIKRFCGILLIIFGIYFGYSAVKRHLDNTGHGSIIVEKVKTGELILDDDASVIKDHIGKEPMFLVFFGSWCTKCRHEIPDLNKLYSEYKDRGLVFYGVDIDDPESKARSFMAEHKMQYPVILDTTRSTFAEKFDILSTPTISIYTRDGKRIYHGGDEPAKLRPVIDKALK